MRRWLEDKYLAFLLWNAKRFKFKWRYLLYPVEGYRAYCWHRLGRAIAKDVQTRMEREGFMRLVLNRGDVAFHGEPPRIKIKGDGNVTAVISTHKDPSK